MSISLHDVALGVFCEFLFDVGVFVEEDLTVDDGEGGRIGFELLSKSHSVSTKSVIGGEEFFRAGVKGVYGALADEEVGLAIVLDFEFFGAFGCDIFSDVADWAVTAECRCHHFLGVISEEISGEEEEASEEDFFKFAHGSLG